MRSVARNSASAREALRRADASTPNTRLEMASSSRPTHSSTSASRSTTASSNPTKAATLPPGAGLGEANRWAKTSNTGSWANRTVSRCRGDSTKPSGVLTETPSAER